MTAVDKSAPDRKSDPAQATGASAGPAREVELKLRLRQQDLAPLRARLDALLAASGSTNGPDAGLAQRARVDNIYYDTPGHRLAAQRAALRLRCLQSGRRRRWVQTLKTEEGEAALSARGEWEVPAPDARLDPAGLAESPLAHLLDASGPEGLPALAPVFRTTFERTSWSLRYRGARIEAVIDEGRIIAGAASEPICEAELELQEGSATTLFDLALHLCAAGGPGAGALALLPYGSSKAARGYRLAAGASDSPRAARASALPARIRLGAAARCWVAQGSTLLLANTVPLAGRVLPDTDPEFVHQARIALRRLRSGLDLLGAHARLPAGLERDLRVWAARLGTVRDWDVMDLQVLPALARAGTAAPQAWARVQQAVGTRRTRAQARLCTQLDTPAYAQFALRLLRWSAQPAPDSGPRMAAYASRILALRLRKLRRLTDDYATLSFERQHKSRIQAKLLRYGTEMLQDCIPRAGVRRQLRALARFQDAVGCVQDARVAQETLGALTRSPALRYALAEWAQAEQRRHTPRAQRHAQALRKLR